VLSIYGFILLMTSWTPWLNRQVSNGTPTGILQKLTLSELRFRAAKQGCYEVAKALGQTGSSSTRIFFKTAAPGQFMSTAAQLISSAADNHRPSVCVIWNISPVTAAALGYCWEMNSQFFIGHASSPPRENVWDIWSHPRYEPTSFSHIRGILEYHGL
jgi:hypothetical protein